MQNFAWHVSSLRQMPEAAKQKWFDSLTNEEAAALEFDWSFWARPKQLPPDGSWLVWLIRSGRGFGKTRTGVEWIIDRAKNGPFHPIALVGQTKADVRDTMIEVGDSSIMKRSPPWFMPKYEPSKRRLTWPNGVMATIFSGDEPDQLRGPQHGTAWVDELAKFKYPDDTWSNLMFGLRLGDRPQVCVTTTPRPIAIINKLLKDPDTIDIIGSSFENHENLSRVFFNKVLKPYIGTRLGMQEIEGKVLNDVPGSLWKQSDIDNSRANAVPRYARIVVGVDPNTTQGDEAGECGIIVAARGEDGHGYVLEDGSIDKASPAEWGSQVVRLYQKWGADSVVAEVNQGGDMVEHTIRTVRDNDDKPIGKAVNILKVRAARGKYVRAEPISALYEQFRIHHVGNYAELETQMTTWLPGEKSPDRMDALVWALTELFVADVVSELEEESEIIPDYRG